MSDLQQDVLSDLSEVDVTNTTMASCNSDPPPPYNLDEATASAAAAEGVQRSRVTVGGETTGGEVTPSFCASDSRAEDATRHVKRTPAPTAWIYAQFRDISVVHHSICVRRRIRYPHCLPTQRVSRIVAQGDVSLLLDDGDGRTRRRSMMVEPDVCSIVLSYF